ncbi:hypothetical protein V6Z11_A12G011400 [Gossypium hirsutum]
MEQRPLELTVVFAEGLKKVKHLSKMDVYVVVKVSGGDSSTEQKTPVHKDGGTSPRWNHPMLFSFNESLAQTNTTLAITFRLMCCRTFRGDKEIGEARVPIKELLDSAGNGNSAKYTTFPVKKPSGKAKGKLNLVYRFGEKAANAVPAYPLVMTAMNPLYPPPHNAALPAYPTVGYSYAPVGFQQLPVQEAYKPDPQPPAGSHNSLQTALISPPKNINGKKKVEDGSHNHKIVKTTSKENSREKSWRKLKENSALNKSEILIIMISNWAFVTRINPSVGPGLYSTPPPAGYPQMEPGNGYPPVVQPERKNESGDGLALGAAALVGGLLGGILLGDMVSDAAASYEAGCDPYANAADYI